MIKALIARWTGDNGETPGLVERLRRAWDRTGRLGRLGIGLWVVMTALAVGFWLSQPRPKAVIPAADPPKAESPRTFVRPTPPRKARPGPSLPDGPSFRFPQGSQY